MTDRETIFAYRMRQTEETLFIHSNTPHKTSKHSGVIGIFNKEFIFTGKLDARFAKMLYDLFDQRIESDYRDFAELSEEDARHAVLAAQEFVTAIKALTKHVPNTI